MEDEQEDVKKMNDFINKQKTTYQSSFQLEFQDFVTFRHDYDISDQEFDDEDDEHETFFEDNSVKSINEEEQYIIDSCTDPELKKLLILNRSKNLQLLKLHKKIQELLLECEEEMEEKKTILKNSEAKQQNQQTCLWKLSAPYFKDKKFFPCPLNADTKKKRAQNELNIYDLVPSPKWTPIEFDRLTNAIKCNYNINRQNNLMTKISILKARMQNEEIDDKNNIQEMLLMKEELEKLKHDDKVPPLNSNEFINWYKVSETFLKDKHTATECQSVWHMLIHPSINKSEWTDEESKNLEALAKRYSYQKWDEIAHKLDTNRTGFTACLHYFSKLCDKFKKNKFTSEEDAFLLEVVDIYKIGNFIPWNKVVCHFTDRSRHQLYHRYTYFLSQNHVKRGKFSEAEDVLLMILVNKFGRNFKKCTEYMPHRSQIQLKSRYNTNLQRHIKKGTFTSEDDQMIYDYAQKYGEKSWGKVANQLNRCNAQIRQRYKLIKSFLHENPGSNIADIPKRRHRFDEINEGQHNFLNYMAEQYKDVEFIPTLPMIEESLQAQLGASSSDIQMKPKNIDAMLTDFFSSSMKMKQCNVITETILKEASQNVEEILRLLGANLSIPKDLECDRHLDNIDSEILEIISKKENNECEPKIERLLPPNLSTLVGLRSLIIKHKEYKSKQKDKSDNLLWAMRQNLITLSAKDRSDTLFHRDLFSKRFDSLFDWSAILSLEKPNPCNIPNESATANSAVGTITMPKNTYTKRPSSQANLKVKKRKVDITALTDLSLQVKDPQVTVVDRYVIENLIQKNNFNIVRIENVTNKNGEVESILQPSHSFTAQSESRQDSIDSSSVSATNCIENAVDDGDIQDVKRLNAILKSVKSEAPGDSSSDDGDEYQVIKDDVQLLKEILNYEKEKVKPDPSNF